MNNAVSDSRIFTTNSSLEDARFAIGRKPGRVSFSKLFVRPSRPSSSKKYRFITIGLEEMERNYLAASLGKELILSQEKAGRTEIRLLITEDGFPCEFIIQRYDVTKDGYEKIGVSLQSEDIDRLLVAILVHRHYRHAEGAGKETGERLSLAKLIRRLEPIAAAKAKEQGDDLDSED